VSVVLTTALGAGVEASALIAERADRAAAPDIKTQTINSEMILCAILL